jgi:hypothetical protein
MDSSQKLHFGQVGQFYIGTNISCSTTARRSSIQPCTEAHPSNGKQKPKRPSKFTTYGKLRPRNGNFYGISSMGQSRALPEHTWTAKQF